MLTMACGDMQSSLEEGSRCCRTPRNNAAASCSPAHGPRHAPTCACVAPAADCVSAAAAAAAVQARNGAGHRGTLCNWALCRRGARGGAGGGRGGAPRLCAPASH